MTKMQPTINIRLFKPDDTDRVLELANLYTAFDGETTEADLLITRYFPRGFWVAETEGQVVGFFFTATLAKFRMTF